MKMHGAYNKRGRMVVFNKSPMMVKVEINCSTALHCPPKANAAWPSSYASRCSGVPFSSPRYTEFSNHWPEYKFHAVFPTQTKHCTKARWYSKRGLSFTALLTSVKGAQADLRPSPTSLS